MRRSNEGVKYTSLNIALPLGMIDSATHLQLTQDPHTTAVPGTLVGLWRRCIEVIRRRTD
ncbi:hypothetical protein E2C01_067317 [Portunus trituberculatus]|uniref:Uncharacterized protein n=1 Tax=Portunus trituberculatus TaxID=210409 RepID=A0A5B7HJG6_PORTR|nr:hypothetical protein [Portunus trituberculatus]